MAFDIIARKDARAQGLTYYFTGKPCPSGHVTRRFVTSCGCRECVRIKGNARNLPGGPRAPKGIRANARAARALARAKGLVRYFSGEPCHVGHVAERHVSSGHCCDCLTIWRNNYRNTNRDRVNAQARKDRAANVEKARERDRNWRCTPHGRAIKTRIQNKRRARKFGFSEHYTPEDVHQILKAQRHRCAYCRVNVSDCYEIDHIVPLARGGADDRRNIQIVCAPCNRQKQAKDPIKHARDLGMLI